MHTVSNADPSIDRMASAFNRAEAVTVTTATAAGSSHPPAQRRACFIAFMVLLICSITLTIIFFVLAIFDLLFVYTGVACLAANLFVIAVYFIFLRCCRAGYKDDRRRQRIDTLDDDGGGVHDDGEEDLERRRRRRRRPRRRMLNTPEGRLAEYRRLEREIQWLSNEIVELLATSLCNSSDLERAQDLARQDYEIVSGWIEGLKTPETFEIKEVSRAVRRLANRVRAIRTRSERISASLLYSNSTPAYIDIYGQQVDRMNIYPPPPPPYFESQEQINGDVISSPLPIDLLLESSSPSYHSSFTNGSSVTTVAIATPPPTYEDATGSPV